MVTFSMPEAATEVPVIEGVRLSNGVRLNVAQQGPRAGAAVLLLHGYTDSWRSFGRVMPLLPAGLRVIAPDLRGHGDSDRPEFGYAISDLAGDVVLLMDALRVPSAVVVGHSMGSFVARRVAMMAGDRVTGLVLMGSGPSADTPVMRELWTAVQGLADPVDAAFVREFQVSTVSQPPPDAFMEAAIANSLRMPAWTWRALLRGLIDDEPLSRPPSCKALVVGGRQDAIFSVSEQTALARQLPKGELELVSGVGHALHWEQPERFVHALARVGVSGALTPL